MRIISLMIALALLGCSLSDGQTFTLYRNGAFEIGAKMRVHVASFDSDDGGDYNQENCEQARALFQNQPGVNTKFWCEKGRYKK